MKLNYKITLIAIIVLILISSVIVLVSFNKEDKKSDKNVKKVEEEHVAYVSINPLIKLIFKVTCENDICDKATIKDYKLINDEAKEIYKDIDIRNKPIEETIEILFNIAKNNNINVNKIHVYTSYEGEITADVDYDIDIQIKDEKELTDDKIHEFIEKENYIKKTVRFEVADKVCYKEEFNLKEYVMNMNFINNYSIDKAIIEIEGPESIVSNMCTNSYRGYNDVCDPEKEIRACISIGNLGVGRHEVPIEFKSSVDGIEIIGEKPNIIYNVEIIKRPE